jgi:hypothetical protein
MTNPYKNFKTDADLETGGVWFDYGLFRIRLARAGGANEAFTTLVGKKTKPYRRAIELDTMDKKVAERLFMEAFCEAVVLDWEVQTDDGWRRGVHQPDTAEVLPVNLENVMWVFKENPDLYRECVSDANKLSNFLAARREEEAGN